jgi:hypothetical protein
MHAMHALDPGLTAGMIKHRQPALKMMPVNSKTAKIYVNGQKLK